MILKLMIQPWITVQRMMKVGAGFLFVLTGPPLLLAQVLIWTYVGARAAHFVAYSTAQLHDIRAFCWTWSSLAVIGMAAYVLMQVL